MSEANEKTPSTKRLLPTFGREYLYNPASPIIQQDTIGGVAKFVPASGTKRPLSRGNKYVYHRNGMILQTSTCWDGHSSFTNTDIIRSHKKSCSNLTFRIDANTCHIQAQALVSPAKRRARPRQKTAATMHGTISSGLADRFMQRQPRASTSHSLALFNIFPCLSKSVDIQAIRRDLFFFCSTILTLCLWANCVLFSTTRDAISNHAGYQSHHRSYSLYHPVSISRLARPALPSRQIFLPPQGTYLQTQAWHGNRAAADG